MARKQVIAATMFVAFGFACALSAAAMAKANEDTPLRETIHRLDQELFDSFNKCADGAELAKHASYFAEDVEFYHDNGGVTWNREAMLANTKRYACGKYTRELVEETFNVSPVKDFGAIATGVHRFCQSYTHECAGEADFVMVWRNTNGKWEVTRTLSFGHRAATTPASIPQGIGPAAMEDVLDQNKFTSVSIALIENGVADFAGAPGHAKSGGARHPRQPLQPCFAHQADHRRGCCATASRRLR